MLHRIATGTTFPIFVQWGSHDSTVDTTTNLKRWRQILEHKTNLADQRPRKLEFQIFDKAGHSFYLENAAEVHASTLRFLNDVSNDQ